MSLIPFLEDKAARLEAQLDNLRQSFRSSTNMTAAAQAAHTIMCKERELRETRQRIPAAQAAEDYFARRAKIGTNRSEP